MKGHTAPALKPRSTSAPFGRLAVTATGYFLLVIVGMHVLSPAIDPVNRPTSDYATGPFGYLMTSAFLALSLATWCLVLGVNRSLRPQGTQRVGLAFLGWFGIALLIAAAFPIDAEGAPHTVHGLVHGINGPLAFFSLTLATNFISRLFRLQATWRPIHRLASGLARLMIPAFIVTGAAAAAGTGVGIAQRVMIAIFATWFFIVGSRLRRA
jgi:hypothetical protein